MTESNTLPSLFPKLLTILACVCLTACAPDIGDACETSAECPSGSICDVTAPGGYCTVDGCDTESCPDGSVCVEFTDEETFCMKYCEDPTDCRNDYACREDVGPAPFCYAAAEIAE